MSTAPHRSSLSVTEVQQTILDTVQPLRGSQPCALSAALKRVLAAPVIAPLDVPAFDNSAMDGYAFGSHSAPSVETLTVVGKSYAGHPFSGRLETGQAIHITTGATLPNGADTVIPLELAVLDNPQTLRIKDQPWTPGQHRRLRGEDLKSGEVVLDSGTTLGAPELGVLAAMGLAEVSVTRQVKVAIFSTGDELRQAGQTLDDGCVFDSNRMTLHALLMQAGAEVVDLGVLADEPVAIKSALQSVIDQVDMIITSGGMAGGAADFTAHVMQQLGQMQFWSVAMRPGRPLAFGQIARPDSSAVTTIFGLPGNPVAMMISFYLFVRPAIQRLAAATVSLPVAIKAIAQHAIPKKVGRTEFQRGIYSLNEGTLQVSSTGEQGSNLLSSMVRANCLIMLEPSQGDVSAGETVGILMFQGLIG